MINRTGPQAEAVAGARVWSRALVAICLGYFMVILDTTVVNVALPALRADLNADVVGLQWIVDGYLLMLASLVLFGGAACDRFGARRVFLAGLAVFVATSAGCGVAPNVPTLVIARLAQGVGAALSVPASLALLRAAFPDSASRAKAIGIWGGVAGVAAATGPIIGGVLVSAASWRWVFFVNVPVGLAALAWTARHVPAPQPRPRRLDPIGQLLATLASAGLTVALIRSDASPVTICAGAAFVGAGIAFVITERTVPEPMLPLGLFADRSFASGTVIGLLINLGFYGELFVLNLYLQQIRGYSALLAGVAVLPQMGMATFGSALSGRITARIGSPRPTLLIGLSVGGFGLLGFCLAGGESAYPWLILPLAATGFGMSFTMPAATTAVVDGAPPERAGLASGTINAARQLGGVLGVAVLGALTKQVGSAFLSGFHVAMLLAGSAFLLGAVVAAIGVPADGPISARRSPRAPGAGGRA